MQNKPRKFWIDSFGNYFDGTSPYPYDDKVILAREVMPDENISDLQIIINNAIEERDRLKARIKELEAKLSIAVRSLEYIRDEGYKGTSRKMAINTLREIHKGSESVANNPGACGICGLPNVICKGHNG